MYHVGLFKCKTPNEKLQSPLRNKLSPAQKSEISFDSSLQSFHIGGFFSFFSFFFQVFNPFVLIFMKLFQICQNLRYFFLVYLEVCLQSEKILQHISENKTPTCAAIPFSEMPCIVVVFFSPHDTRYLQDTNLFKFCQYLKGDQFYVH